MRFASRLIPHAGGSVRGYFLLALGVLALGLGGGCEDKHIGRPCVTNAADAGASGGQVAVISSPNLQCPSRICLEPAPEGAVTTASSEGAFCTAPCSTDDDCSDADPGTKCTTGFVCTWPTTSGPFCCQKMCVCHDFVVVPKGGFPVPSTCESPGSGGPSPPTCVNVSP
jgi:hypothetical protein